MPLATVLAAADLLQQYTGRGQECRPPLAGETRARAGFARAAQVGAEEGRVGSGGAEGRADDGVMVRACCAHKWNLCVPFNRAPSAPFPPLVP